jgi:DNA-directed RNA polymerase specialized sigma24 family protein
MGLFIAAGTSSSIDGVISNKSLPGTYSERIENFLEVAPHSVKPDLEQLETLRKYQAEVIEILNIGEAINSKDFQERCAEDSHLTVLSFEASERMLQEVEIQDFITNLPSELAELVEFLDEGMTTREIAKIKGVAKGTIQYRIEKLRSITRAYFASAVAA